MYMENRSTPGGNGSDKPNGSGEVDVQGILFGALTDEASAVTGADAIAPDGDDDARPMMTRMPIAVGDDLRVLPRDLGITDPVPAPKRPGAVARLLAFMLADEAGVHLKHWRDSWHVWRDGRTGGRYRPLAGANDKYAVSDMVRSVLENAVYQVESDKGPDLRPWDPNSASVREVVEALAAASRPDEDMVSGTWIGPDAAEREATTPGSEITCVANGLLWCPKAGGSAERKLLDHTPSFFTTSAVTVDYDPDATCPRWLRFLDELWPDDPDSQALLQEWFGYVLSGSASLHKILTLVGPPRSGKGTIAWTLETLLGGPSQVDHPTLRRLSERFGLASMLGKRLAVVGDARIGKSDAAVVEQLLMISGEDPVTVERKHVADVTVTLDTRIMINSNAMPDLRDVTGALASRFLPLTIRVEGFLGREDFGLKDDLEREMPGILAWALAGADRLWERGGRFTIGEQVAEAMREVERSSSTIKAFAMDCLTLDPQGTVLKDPLYDVYEAWCAGNRYHAKSKPVFVRDLRSAYPGIGDVRLTQPDGSRARGLTGVRLGADD